MTNEATANSQTSPPSSPVSSGPSLKSRAARGSLWTILGFGGGQAIRFVGNLIMTRLLFEEAFGVMALVWVFLQGIALFSDIGIGPSIIQNKRGEDQGFLNTAWTIQVGRGFLLWAVSCVGAVPFAQFYGEPVLASIIPVAGLAAFFSGFFSTKLFSVNRHLTVGGLALIEIASQILSLIVMILWALVDRSVWALAAGGIAGPVAKLVLSHVALPGERNRLHWNATHARELFRFGRWIFFSTALTFLAAQSDRLIFGKMIPMAVLGVYHIGVTFATMPVMALEQLGSKIVFPLLSRIHHEQGNLSESFRRVRWPLLVGSGWLLSGFIAGGTTIIDLLYDARYSEAGWIVQFLSVGSWVCVTDMTYKSALLARGQANMVAAASLAKVIGMVTLIPLGFALFEFPGAVLGLVTSEVFRLTVSFVSCLRTRISSWKQDLTLALMVALAGGCGWYSDVLAARWFDGSIPIRIGAVFIVVTLLWSPFGWRTFTQLRQRPPSTQPSEQPTG